VASPQTHSAPVTAIPEEFAHSGISPLQLLAIMRAYRLQLAIIAVTLMVLAAVGIKFIPKTYIATTTLIVNLETRDPLAGRDFPVEMVSSYVATQTELMLSPIVLLPVIDQLKLTQDPEFTAGFSGDRAALREFVEKKLAATIYIETGRGGQLLYIQTFARDARKAADIGNAIADVYIEQDRRRTNDPANERAQRYAEELAELRQKTVAAQDRVTQFRKQNGISEIAATTSDSEVQALDNLQQRLLETQNQRRSLEAKLSGQESTTDEVMASNSVQSLRATQNAQQAQLAQLSATYGPKHPKIRELQSQIAMTNQALARETGTLSANISTELTRTKELEKKFIQAVADQQAKVLKLRQSQDDGAKLLLELESAQTVYKHALDGFDQIMFSAAANHTNVSIVSRAVPPLKAAKPNKIKLMLMAILGGIGAGIVAPLAYELFLNRRIRCRDDLERGFGIPVLAQLDTQLP
jgi:uncharacterized protein involved in exopolysaccharide biosynthesis